MTCLYRLSPSRTYMWKACHLLRPEPRLAKRGDHFLELFRYTISQDILLVMSSGIAACLTTGNGPEFTLGLVSVGGKYDRLPSQLITTSYGRNCRLGLTQLLLPIPAKHETEFHGKITTDPISHGAYVCLSTLAQMRHCRLPAEVFMINAMRDCQCVRQPPRRAA